jgi:hypothetical protein
MKTELRFTDSNAASDSSGRTWGLEGNLFWWLVGGVGAGLILFFLLLVACRAGLMTSFGVAVVPILLCLAYIFGLRQGKPPGFDRDCLEFWLGGAGFGPDERQGGALIHPLSEEGSWKR